MPEVGTKEGETDAVLIWAPLTDDDGAGAGDAAATPGSSGREAAAYLRYWATLDAEDEALEALWKAKNDVPAATRAMESARATDARANTLAKVRARPRSRALALPCVFVRVDSSHGYAWHTHAHTSCLAA